MAIESKFYLADEFRPMADGKPMAIGLYPDLTVVLDVPSETEQLKASGEKVLFSTDLTALISLKGLERGNYPAEGLIRRPGGELHGKLDGNGMVIESNGVNTCVIIVVMKGIAFSESGRYVFELNIPGFDPIAHHFDIEFSGLPKS